MAITATSTMYDVQITAPISSRQQQVLSFNYLQAAVAGTGAATIALLPKGKIRIDFAKSSIIAADASASATLSVGYGAYVNADTNESVVADANAFLDAYAIDATPAPTAFVAPSGETEQTEFNTAAGLKITATVAGGNMDQNDLLKGWIVFSYIE